MNADRGEKLAAELGDNAIFSKADVTKSDENAAAVKKTIDAFGKIDIAINCAGIGDPAKVVSKEGPMPLERFTWVIQVNLIGTFDIIRLAAAEMVKNEPNQGGERGVIINTSSGAAFEGQIGQPSYSASKAAINGMTLPIARELAAHGIRVVTIAPGLFDTPLLAQLSEPVKASLGKQTPFPPRLGVPREYSQLALHIVENPMLNGETIRLDGALRMQAK
jgi:NAD(P)-dependent dehydrogenase (short-subunit alcohol dehydrogenase family)